MEGNRINKLYSIAVAYPTLIAIIGTVIFVVYENQDYQSEWLTAESVIVMMIGISVIYSFVIAFLALTIFLTKVDWIQSNFLLSFLSWFLFPLGFMTFILIHELENTTMDEMKIIYLLIRNVPFLGGLIWSYCLYLKTKNLQEQE